MKREKDVRTEKGLSNDLELYKTLLERTKKGADLSETLMKLFVQYLKEEKKLSFEDIVRSMLEEPKVEEEIKEVTIPTYIFDNDKLSCLEAVVKYLKEELKLRYYEIASMLNRNHRTIWTTYANARRKMPERFIVKKSKYFLKISILEDRKLGVLEVISEYLKDEYKLTYHQIAIILNRNDRTIWTVYNRAKVKRRRNKIVM